MKDTLIIQASKLWNQNKAFTKIQEIVSKIDMTEKSALKMNGECELTDSLQVQNESTRKVDSAYSFANLEISGNGTYIASSLEFPGSAIIKQMKEGTIIVSSKEITSLGTFLEERAVYLNKYKKIVTKIEEHESNMKSTRSKRRLKAEFDEEFIENTELSEEENKINKEIHKKHCEDKYLEYKETYNSEVNKIKEKIEKQKNKRIESKMRLGMGEFSFKFLLKETFTLLKSSDMIYINKEAGVLILKINKKAGFTYNDLDKATELAEKLKGETKDSLEEHVLNNISFFSNIEYKLNLPIYVGQMSLLEEEMANEIDILSTISMAGSIPVAPVKPSIAAAMLASGAGGKLDKEITHNGESCLIKTAITPIQKTETIKGSGQEDIVTVFSWEPQLGLFNKLRKEFQILT